MEQGRDIGLATAEFRISGISASLFSVDSETRGANAKGMRIIRMAAPMVQHREKESPLATTACVTEPLMHRFIGPAGTILAS